MYPIDHLTSIRQADGAIWIRVLCTLRNRPCAEQENKQEIKQERLDRRKGIRVTTIINVVYELV